MRLEGNWSIPTSVRFGAGRIAELGEAVKSVGIAKPLLVTDAQLAATPPIDRARQSLAAAGVAVAVFADVKANPVAANIEAGVAVLRMGRLDVVIACGGGKMGTPSGDAYVAFALPKQ